MNRRDILKAALGGAALPIIASLGVDYLNEVPPAGLHVEYLPEYQASLVSLTEYHRGQKGFACVLCDDWERTERDVEMRQAYLDELQRAVDRQLGKGIYARHV